MATTTRLTIDEYLARDAGDLRWTELVDGEIVVMEPKPAHARLQAKLIHALANYEDAGGGVTVFAPTAVRLSEHDLYGPDVVVTRADAPISERGWFAELPLLCVEVRSPTTWRYDIGHKKATYEARGLPELWLVDGYASTVLAFRRSAPAHPAFDVTLELGRASCRERV